MGDRAPSAFDRVNRHGARLCDAVGCRRHKRLYSCFRGCFCKRHAEQLAQIREELVQQKGHGATEVAMRQMEVLYRKHTCPGHMHYLLGLELAFIE